MKITIPVTFNFDNATDISEEKLISFLKGDIVRVLNFNYDCNEFLTSDILGEELSGNIPYLRSIDV